LTGTSSRAPYEDDRRSSDEIRRDIERQRDELDVTTKVLQHKLAPRELAEQLWHDMRDRVGGGADEVVHLVKRHPLPLGLIGAGIAWWIYESSSGRGPSFGNGDDYDRDDTGVGSMSTGSYRSGSGSSYASAYQSGGEEESEGWRQRAGRAAQRSSERLRTGAASARHGFTEAVDRNPLALGAACFSLGVLAGIAVPSSGWEVRTLGDTSAKVGNRAKRAATGAAVRAAVEGARAAQGAADRLRDVAERSVSSHRGEREPDGSGRTGSPTTGSSSGRSGRQGDGSTDWPSDRPTDWPNRS
jgi:hypothetical protein